MNDIHLITYATHSEGKFEELINNKFNIPVKVLGWGEKWQGFMHKFKIMHDYIKTLPDDDIIFFIDGFDSNINQPIDIIKKNFMDMNSDIVVSKHFESNYIQKKIFGDCKNNLIANAGLYCGYNKSLQDLGLHILKNNDSSDDQRALNSACKYFNNIAIDKDKKLFNNLNHLDRYLNKNYDACFISTPGELTFNRLKRVPGEYLPFIWKEILILIIIIFVFCLYIQN